MEPRLWELAGADPHDEVRAVVRLRGAVDPPSDMRIIATFGDIATCRLLRADIEAVRNHPSVVSLKAPQAVSSVGDPEPTARGSHVYDVIRPNVGEKGRGVVVGVVDYAADFANLDFRRVDDELHSTRFRSMYIMNERGERTGNNRYGRGRVYEREEINAALTARNPYEALGYHPGHYVPGGASHGSHVMGIAVGNGQGSGKPGIAPEAEIVFCQPDSSDLPLSLNFGDSVGVLESCDHVLRSADGLPTVINLSIGRHAGPHDGSTLVEAALDNLMRLHHGVVILNSCGNYHLAKVHASGRLMPGEARSLRWQIDASDESHDELEVWYDNADEFLLELIAPGGERFGPVARGDVVDVVIGGQRVGRFYHRPDREPGSQRHMAACFLGTSAPSGTWQVEIGGEQVSSGRFDAWIERDGGQQHQSRFAQNDADRTRTTGTIANARNMISVGCYDGRNPTRPLSRFSSAGPTVDGRRKPDILAPGVMVRSSSSMPLSGEYQALAIKSGTSMAAPHVTGTVALMLEAAGGLPPVHVVRRSLFETAIPVPDASEHHRSGHGYLHAEAAIKRIREIWRTPDAKSLPTGRPVMRTNVHQPVDPAMAEVNGAMQLPGQAESEIVSPVLTEDSPLIPGLRPTPDGRRVTVNMSDRANTTIAGLAELLHLPPRRVFQVLLRNSRAIRHLWENEIYNEAEAPRWPGTAAARRQLQQTGNQEVTRVLDVARQRTVTEPAFYNFGITIDFGETLTFRMSAALRAQLADLAGRRAREARRQALRPVVARVRQVLGRVLSDAGMLRVYMEMIARVLAEPIKEVALLEMLLGISNAMLHPRSAQGQSSSRRAAVRALTDRVEGLKRLAHRHMLLERPNLANERARRDRHARQLLSELEGSAFLRDLREITADAELLPKSDIEYVCDALSTAYSALIVSPLEDQIVDGHILPFIDLLASVPFDYDGFTTHIHPGLGNALRDAPTAAPPTTALTIVGELFLRTPDLVGNTPGPDSLAVAMLEISAPVLVERIMSNAVRDPANINRLSSRLYRAFCTAARLDRAQRVALLEAVDRGNLSRIRQLNWSRGFQNGVGFGSIISVISLIALISAIRSDDSNTVQRWADIIGSLSGVITGAATVSRGLSLTSALMRNGMVAAGAKAIGVIGGVAAVVSGIAEASERHERGDSTGMWLAVGGSVGGAMTVGGFLIALGAGSSATIAGAPIGAVLAVAGVVVSLRAAIWGLVRDWRITSGHRLFEAILEHFGRRDGDFTFVARSRPELRQAFRRVQTTHHDTRFWGVAFSIVPQLADLGFRDADIALLTDRNEAAVTAVLRAQRPERYTAPARGNSQESLPVRRSLLEAY